MAINPSDISTIRVGELPSAPFNLTDNIPHEVGAILAKGSISDLIELISGYIDSSDGLAFNPTTIIDGGTLPDTSSNEWILVGRGTFHNVSGSPDIITTEELNAITSNGSFWTLSVEIPINVELAGIVQTIREGETDTCPSENAVFNALASKADVSDIPNGLPPHLKFSNTDKTVWNNGKAEEESNTIFGQYAFASNSSAVYCTAFGYASLANNTTGSYCTAFGYQSLQSNEDGSSNVAVGNSALYSNINGSFNLAVGNESLYSNEDGSSNTAIGTSALYFNTEGSNCLAIGNYALYNNESGDYNIGIGDNADVASGALTNVIVIGNDAIATASNTVKIGNSSVTDNYFTGNIRGGAFIKSGGTSSQYLMADGSVTTTSAPPYSVYKALINQTGTSAPTVTILENTIGTIVWSRFGTGTYFGTLVGAFPIGRTECICGNSIISATTGMTLARLGDNLINLHTYNTSTNTNADDVLQFGYQYGTSIEIRVYP
jgi:hypothetical protein